MKSFYAAVPCTECQTVFTPHRKGVTCCSDECRRTRDYKTRKARRVILTPPWVPIDALCGACETPFLRMFESQKYCASTCREKSKGKRPNGTVGTLDVFGLVGFREDRPRVSKAPPLLSCPNCRSYGYHNQWCPTRETG